MVKKLNYDAGSMTTTVDNMGCSGVKIAFEVDLTLTVSHQLVLDAGYLEMGHPFGLGDFLQLN